MAISKIMRAALRAITALEPDVKRSYKMERRIERMAVRLRGHPGDFKIWDRPVHLGDRVIPVRLFAPPGVVNARMLLFFHGGGWVTGGIDNYTRLCVDLARATGQLVASVDYRLAPEHKFPTAPEDCYYVAREFFMGGAPSVDPDGITLIGDSAGGNLAAVVSLMARDRGEFLPRRQILIYPSTYGDHSETSPFASIRDNGTDFLLTSRRIEGFIDLYIRSPEDLLDPYCSPLLAPDLSRQPRTLIVTAEYCPLRDEGEAYGERLRAAGNDVEIARIMDALHSFMMLPPSFNSVRQTLDIINTFLERE